MVQVKNQVLTDPGVPLRFLVIPCRVYFFFVFFLGFSVLSLPHFACLALVALVLAWRGRSGKELFLIPDALLVCLPFFWALNGLWSHTDLSRQLVMPQFLLFGSLLAILGPEWLQSGFSRTSLTRSLLASLVVFLGFMAGLKSVFPQFLPEDFRRLLLGAYLFYSGIPVCQAAMLGRGFSWDSFGVVDSGAR